MVYVSIRISWLVLSSLSLITIAMLACLPLALVVFTLWSLCLAFLPLVSRSIEIVTTAVRYTHTTTVQVGGATSVSGIRSFCSSIARFMFIVIVLLWILDSREMKIKS